MFESLNDKLKGNILARKLSCKFSLADADVEQNHFELSDPLYLPFYYFLGNQTSSKAILEIGFGLGLCSGAYLQGSNTVQNFVGFQEKSSDYYPHRTAIHNIKRVYKNKLHFYYGDIHDLDQKLLKDMKIDLVILRNKTKENISNYLNYAWEILEYDGVIVADYLDYHEDNMAVFNTFSKVRNRKPELFKTRYGNGIIVK